MSQALTQATHQLSQAKETALKAAGTTLTAVKATAGTTITAVKATGVYQSVVKSVGEFVCVLLFIWFLVLKLCSIGSLVQT